VHDGIYHYDITLNTIVYAERKAINEMTAYIFFNNLPGFRICEDAFYARFNGLDEGFG